MQGQLSIFDDPTSVSLAVANLFVDYSRDAIATGGRFSVALAGGSTPKQVYKLLATDDYKNKISWDAVHVFFGDERCVPADHEDSNFHMANEALLSHVPIPSANIHRIDGEGEVNANAARYEAELRHFFGPCDWPRFNLVMLGMGEDGHTASLFPGSNAVNEDKAWVVPNWVEKLNAFRITLSAPAINHSEHIVFTVVGAEKAERLKEVLRGPRDAKMLPSQLICPTKGSLEFLVDKAAASAFA